MVTKRPEVVVTNVLAMLHTWAECFITIEYATLFKLAQTAVFSQVNLSMLRHPDTLDRALADLFTDFRDSYPEESRDTATMNTALTKQLLGVWLGGRVNPAQGFFEEGDSLPDVNSYLPLLSQRQKVYITKMRRHLSEERVRLLNIATHRGYLFKESEVIARLTIPSELRSHTVELIGPVACAAFVKDFLDSNSGCVVSESPSIIGNLYNQEARDCYDPMEMLRFFKACQGKVIRDLPEISYVQEGGKYTPVFSDPLSKTVTLNTLAESGKPLLTSRAQLGFAGGTDLSARMTGIFVSILESFWSDVTGNCMGAEPLKLTLGMFEENDSTPEFQKYVQSLRCGRLAQKLHTSGILTVFIESANSLLREVGTSFAYLYDYDELLKLIRRLYPLIGVGTAGVFSSKYYLGGGTPARYVTSVIDDLSHGMVKFHMLRAMTEASSLVVDKDSSIRNYPLSNCIPDSFPGGLYVHDTLYAEGSFLSDSAERFTNIL